MAGGYGKRYGRRILWIIFTGLFWGLIGCGKDGGVGRKLMTSDGTQPIYTVQKFDMAATMDYSTEFYYLENMTLCKYLLEEDRREEIEIGDIGDYYETIDYVVYQKYMKNGIQEIWRYDKATKEKKMLVAGKIGCYNFGIVDNYVWYEEQLSGAYIFPVDGNIESDIIEINSLFSEENRTGEYQVIIAYGMEICRYYFAPEQRYVLSYIKKAASGSKEKRDRTPWSERTVSVDGKEVRIWRESEGNNYKYYFGYEDEKAWEISCLGYPQYNYLSIADSEYIVDDGMIIGFFRREQLKGHPFPFVKPPKYREVLISLNPYTGKSRILCETEDGSVSMIGYCEKRLYVVKNHKVYRQYMESGVEEELQELPEGNNFALSWRAGYLVVIRNDGEIKGEIVGTYKLE